MSQRRLQAMVNPEEIPSDPKGRLLCTTFSIRIAALARAFLLSVMQAGARHRRQETIPRPFAAGFAATLRDQVV